MLKNDLFDWQVPLHVDISMDEQDWNSLSWDGPQISDWSAMCVFEGFPSYRATVTIIGERVDDVDIRKKGWIGSLTALRPSIKLNFGKGDEFENRRFQGHKRITLNDNKQDPSNIKQCLSYEIFRQAGMPSPRCNFAEVTIQGTNLGTYTHVEAIKKPFLREYFGNDDGNLYELQRDGEFNVARIDYFQLKTNEQQNDRSDLQEVLNALSNSAPETLWDELSSLVNLTQFARFAALETLTGHTDGYTGFQNNTYLYHNPEDDLFYFIPWGTDQSFVETHVVQRQPLPAMIFLGSELIDKLWQNQTFRSVYRAQMNDLLETVWNEAYLIDLASFLGDVVSTDSQLLDDITQFIQRRRSQVLESMQTNNTQWQFAMLSDPDTCPVPNPISGTFAIPATTQNGAEIEFEITYQSELFTHANGSAGIQQSGNTRRLYIFGESSSGAWLDFAIEMPSEFWRPGVVPFHSLETTGFVSFGEDQPNAGFAGFFTDGSIELFSVPLDQSSGVAQGRIDAFVVRPN